MKTERKAANKWLDFFLGWLGLIGLVIELARQQDNEISWRHFIIGFLTMIAGFVLMLMVCVAAVGVAVSEQDFLSCHYDQTTNTSVVLEGSLSNSRTTTYRGNVCQ